MNESKNPYEAPLVPDAVTGEVNKNSFNGRVIVRRLLWSNALYWLVGWGSCAGVNYLDGFGVLLWGIGLISGIGFGVAAMVKAFHEGRFRLIATISTLLMPVGGVLIFGPIANWVYIHGQHR